MLIIFSVFPVSLYRAVVLNVNQSTQCYVNFLADTALELCCSIESNTFHDLASLQRLICFRNKLTALDPLIYNSLTNLEEFYLHGNQFSVLYSRLFKNFARFKRLYLNSDQLTTFLIVPLICLH